MDILDQFSSPPIAKKRGSTSISRTQKSDLNNSVNKTHHPISINTSIRNDIFDRNGSYQNVLTSNNQLGDSYQPKTTNIVSHFDFPSLSNYDQMNSNPSSQKQSRRIPSKGLTSQLGIILSQQGESQKFQQNSQQTINKVSSRRRQPEKTQTNNRRRKTNENDVGNFNTLNAFELAEQLKQIKQKLEEVQNKNRNNQNKLKEKQIELSEVKEKLKYQIQSYSSQRRKGYEQNVKMIEQERIRLKKGFQEQLERRQKLLRWEFQTKNKVQEQKIAYLQKMTSEYKHFFQSNDDSSKLNSYLSSQQKIKQKIYDRHSFGQQNDQNMLEQLRKKQQSLRKLEKKLQRQYQLFYEQKSNQQRKFQREKSNIQQIHDKKRHQIRLERQRICQLQQKISKQHNQNEKMIQKRLRQIEQRAQQTQILRNSLQKQKQKYEQLHKKFMSQFKMRNQDLAEQKSKVYELQAELLKKINIVEQFSKKNNGNKNKVNQTAQICYQVDEDCVQNESLDQTKIKDQGQQIKNDDSTVSLDIDCYYKKNGKKPASSSTSTLLKSKNTKINVENYFLKLDKSRKMKKANSNSKIRPIYRFQQFYKDI